MMILVGDNPFHGISHLSQERSRSRGAKIHATEYATQLVTVSLDNGAEGFMFSVSETTLLILKMLREKKVNRKLKLYAIVPYAYEYVRLATQTGISGLAQKVAKQMFFSANLKAAGMGIKGFLLSDPMELLKTYLLYEITRLKSTIKDQDEIESILLHEIITEIGLALDLDWFFKSYIDFLSELKIKPGFETRNFAFFVNKFKQWGINFSDLVIASPFNRIGFQMNPSRIECEKALLDVPTATVIAMSVLAAGYLKPNEAIGYVRSLSHLKGVVVGVSNESQACQTFKLLSSKYV